MARLLYSFRRVALATAFALVLGPGSVGLISGVSRSGRSGVAAAEGRAPTPGPGQPFDPTNTTLPLASTSAKLTLVTNAEQPLAVVSRPSDSALYVVEKTGRVKVLHDGQLTTILDLSARVSTENEQGLLGLAFPPNQPTRMYVDYTDTSGAVIVSEFAFSGSVADPTSERVVLHISKPFNEHNAGTIVFDHDGLLYIGIGDGGGSGDKFNNGQRLDVLLGKVLRIDPRLNGTKPYGIPASNPFVRATASVVKARPEIYAYGLRNPWRISIDSATGDLWIPDVGQSSYEEINHLPAALAGANLGWRLREGSHSYKGSRPRRALDPLYDYPHADGRCAVVGGAVYRGRALRGLVGSYVFGDVCTGQISVLQPVGNGWQPNSLGLKISYLTAFGTANDGELYATSFEGGVYRIDPS